MGPPHDLFKAATLEPVTIYRQQLSDEFPDPVRLGPHQREGENHVEDFDLGGARDGRGGRRGGG